MMVSVRSWFHENQTLVYFLVGQAIAIGAAVLSITAYMVRLETRVTTLEIRGSPHLEKIDSRLTVLEGQTQDNRRSIERISEIMLRELPVRK
jgi:hypothetical protein